LNVVLTTNARNDIAGAADWYEAKREGLGDEFLGKVDEALDSIGSNPLAYRKVFGENRRCNLEKSPYAFFFKLEGDAIYLHS
jgi:toxin ParE1/3/4